jgi:probable rRNA maturation factor
MKILISNRQRHRPLNKNKILQSATHIFSILKQPAAELSVLFVGDKKMKELNSAYRGINKSTDVLSFEAAIPFTSGDSGNILGDVVINIPRAETQAKESGTAFYHEIYRLLVHGTLHLLGYDHEQSPYQARKMQKKEQELFDAIKKMDSKQ